MAPTNNKQTANSAVQQINPGETLEAVLSGARVANPIQTMPDGRRYALLPASFQLQDITPKDLLPDHIRQTVTLDDGESLTRYTNRFSDSRTILIADIDLLTVTAALDWHESKDMQCAPMPAAHNATLKLRESEEFSRWNEMEGTLHNQMEFAEFLDENASDIVDPAPTVMIEIARDLEATQGVAFKSSNRLQTGERSLVYETETHTKGDMKVPTQFTLQIPLFVGEPPIDIKASFRFRPSSQGLKLGFVWRRVEYRRQAEFSAIAHRVSEATGCPLMMGRCP